MIAVDHIHPCMTLPYAPPLPPPPSPVLKPVLPGWLKPEGAQVGAVLCCAVLCCAVLCCAVVEAHNYTSFILSQGL